MATTYETFTLERSGPIVTVSFNRPAKLNPLNEQVLREFLAITYELQEDEDSRVVISDWQGPFVQRWRGYGSPFQKLKSGNSGQADR